MLIYVRLRSSDINTARLSSKSSS
ncbi:hypothetical protein CWATWH0003_2169b1 [Crocosphaera watsonii WH 0003]|uniref:Uncharacterized protein n=1 Tax=Crocosphaera watsonii WH 0003 TaxID=423471 RepID=G5J3U6_CROWT|nr:hypothetical protein CWATWH0003_2169b1 [Crocosphaera watsonii WH 0003]